MSNCVVWTEPVKTKKAFLEFLKLELMVFGHILGRETGLVELARGQNSACWADRLRAVAGLGSNPGLEGGFLA